MSLTAALLGSAAIGGAASLIGSWFGSKSQKSSNDTNVKLAREQREWEAQQIAKQNEYNSPENQMSRYRDAGLNPNLMYGSISSGNQSNIPTYKPAEVKPVTAWANGISHLGNEFATTLMAAQNHKADLGIKNAQEELLREQKNGLVWKNLTEALGYERAKAYAPYFSFNAWMESRLLDSQYKQNIKQLDIMNSSLSTAELNRILSVGRYQLEHARFNHQQKMDMRNYLKSVEEFKKSMELQTSQFEWNKTSRWIGVGEGIGQGLLNLGVNLIPGGKWLKKFKKIF